MHYLPRAGIARARAPHRPEGLWTRRPGGRTTLPVLPSPVRPTDTGSNKYEGEEHHGNYKIVVTIEAETVDDSHAIASGFIDIPGVTGINLVYANFEDDPTLAEAGSR